MQGAYVLFTGRIPMRAFQTTLLVSMPDLLASVDVEVCQQASMHGWFSVLVQRGSSWC